METFATAESLSIRLTEYSHGAGCGCKIAPRLLDEILESSGGSVEVNADRETTTISVNVLIENAEDAMKIVYDLLTEVFNAKDTAPLAIEAILQEYVNYTLPYL